MDTIITFLIAFYVDYCGPIFGILCMQSEGHVLQRLVTCRFCHDKDKFENLHE
jgi:hypothetical protein